ncbi:type VII secretion target [Nocardia sp. NPDC127579]|uniref:ESX-1 secretion-associated protein n=1 Tax=Nocardia sp. NPDC127579 TaxID=3345402 RepID=UPI0036363244
MANGMDIDPEVLRRLADQHDQVAHDTRAWAQKPTEWLANFEPTYGKIAEPVRQALDRYYDARERAGNALAAEHEDTANSLRASADSYEQTDADSASLIRNTAAPIDNSGSAWTGPAANGMPATDTPTAGSTAAEPGSTAPAAHGAVPGTHTPASMPSDAPGSSSSSPDTLSANETPGTSTFGTTPGGGMAPAAFAPGATATGRDSSDTRNRPATGRTESTAAAPPLTPFAAAVNAAKDKAADPEYLVGNGADNDLVLARTLLAAVLAATDEPGLNWAVAVMRGPAGAGLFLTSDEGRGWLPAGVYLPREISTPWVWDEMLGTGPDDGSPWEGISDPARILVEFGLAWGPKANARLSALASSARIDPGLRARLNDVPMEGPVGPAAEVDLRVFTPDTADRLGLVGSIAALQHIATVPDSMVRQRCSELAVDANVKLLRSVPNSVSAVESRRVREQILAMLDAGQDVPSERWEALRDAHDLLTAVMSPRRIDVTRVDLGTLRVDDQAAELRELVFERRCNELVLLLAQESTRQTLRDAVYAHEQVVNHPQFVDVPAAVSATDTGRPTVTVDAVGGPPRGVTAPPVSRVAAPPETT